MEEKPAPAAVEAAGAIDGRISPVWSLPASSPLGIGSSERSRWAGMRVGVERPTDRSTPGLDLGASAAWLVLSLIWGSTWLAIKIGLADLPPLLFAGIRFAVASGLLLGWAAIRRLSLPTSRRDWLLLVWLGMTNIALSYGLVFWGELHLSAGLTAILFSTAPLFSLLLAHVLIPRERLTVRRSLGSLLGLAGVVTIFWSNLGVTSPQWLAAASGIVFSAFLAAMGSILIKRWGLHLPVAVLSGVQMAVATPFLLLAGLVLGEGASLVWTVRGVGAILYLALIGSALGFALYYWMLRRVRVTTAVHLIIGVVLTAVGLDWLLLGEVLTPRMAIGGGMVLVGLVLAIAPAPPVVQWVRVRG